MPKKKTKEPSIKLSKKHGLNPTIPLCPYCGKPKNEIMLTGAAGEKLAKQLGHKDGDMPMQVEIPGDIEPCDDCKKDRIMVIVTDTEDKDAQIIETLMVKEDAVMRILKDGEFKDTVRETRRFGMTADIARQLGIPVGEEEHELARTLDPTESESDNHS